MKEKVSLRTPLTYYGGKQQLCSTILELIPPHSLYCEPFCGGAAVFFAKEPSMTEVINDTNREVINFYKVVQNDFVSLEKEVRISLHSRIQHNDAYVIFTNPHLFSEIKRAWAIWVLANQSMNSILNNSWSFERVGHKMSAKIQNKKDSFTEDIAIRLQRVQIECADANYIIRTRDYEDAFFYVDPPYINSCQGHYDGYGEADYERLLQNLSEIKGKFLLSSFPSDILNKYIAKNGWHSRQIEMRCAASKNKKRKIEVLTANYPIGL
ncbi:MAG: DNA adenine methylase [Prevotellaceae bacterium]|jgi:DNA adenine methylase|nr:DNA adenine methylase [Prevotellaceae bacterium]